KKLLETVTAVLAAVARLLVAAEGGVGVERAAVHFDLAGTQAAGHGDGAVLVGGPDSAGESVHHPVGDAHGVVLVVVGEDRQHRPEDLLLGDRHLWGDAGEHRRTDVVPGVETLGSAGATGH